jgi:thioredoxin:protein disulfide reductase
MRFLIQLTLAAALLLVPASLFATPVPQSAPNIPVNGSLSPGKTQRGRTVQGKIVIDIPSGYHVNSNRPLERFLIATELQVETQNGIRVGPILYPRPLLRSLKFSKSKVSVFEGRTTIRFSVTVPRNFTGNSAELKARLRFQSCNDDTCFPPQTREVKLWLNVESEQEGKRGKGKGERVRRHAVSPLPFPFPLYPFPRLPITDISRPTFP